MIGQREALRLAGCEAFDPRGNRIGIVGQIFVDAETEQPEWITVQTGLFGTNESFVPLEGAAFDGDTLTVAVPREVVRQAPRVVLEQGDLDPEQEMRLYLHYGVESGLVPEEVGVPTAAATSSARKAGEYMQAVRMRLRRFVAAS